MPVGIRRGRRFRIFLFVSLSAGLIAVAIVTLLSTGQACEGVTSARKVASASPELAVGKRPYLGIIYVPITAHMAAYYELATTSGVLITAVAQGSPAQKAGIQVDDIINELDGLALSNDITIIDVLSQREIGQNVELTIVSNGEWRKVVVALGPRPGN